MRTVSNRGGETARLLALLCLAATTCCRADENKGLPNLSMGALENVVCPKRFLDELSHNLQPEFILLAAGKESRLGVATPAETIRRLGFQAGKPTTIFVHGYRESSTRANWLLRTMGLIRRHQLAKEANYIVMDWGHASRGLYGAVVARVRALARYLAELIRKLTVELGADPMQVHLIGHSLGSHLSGFAGKALGSQLGRITALDPAGPCFGKLASRGPSERLAPTDAHLVEAYHYDDLLFGLNAQVGQVDVYVNGGSNQPGCIEGCPVARAKFLLDNLVGKQAELELGHTRSTEVASHDLAGTSCQQVAYRCTDYASFKRGECAHCDQQNDQCHLMGFAHQYGLSKQATSGVQVRDWPEGRRFYIATSARGSFCLHHFQILVRFNEHQQFGELAKSQHWRVSLHLTDAQGRQVEAKLSNRPEYNVFSYLYLQDGDQEPFQPTGGQLELQQANGAPARKPSDVRPLEVKVSFMSSIDPQVRKERSVRLCPSSTVYRTPSIKSGELVALALC